MSGLLWNSRNQEVISLAMSPEDMSTLHDVYTSLASEQPQQATYVVQILWHELTSNFDAIGSYYSSTESLKSKFVLACLYKTMKIFQLHHFKTFAMVCDGASANLTALKARTGYTGAYGACTTTEKSTPFLHQVLRVLLVYLIWYIGRSVPATRCVLKSDVILTFFHFNTTLQLKNMINTLSSSKYDGTKDFAFQGAKFEWADIEVCLTSST